jgi:hypothetical protein
LFLGYCVKLFLGFSVARYLGFCVIPDAFAQFSTVGLDDGLEKPSGR